METMDMPVIELSGTPRERGRTYGEQARDLIAEVANCWHQDLGGFLKGEAQASESHREAYLKDFLEQTHYISAIQQWAPDLLEEVKGIAEGAGQSLNTILALQMMDEEWVYGLRHGLDKPISKCTAFGIAAHDGISYAGQNMDVPAWVEGRQVLLRIAATEQTPEILVFAIAGTLGVNGLNATGLGITCNTLAQLSYADDGLPVLFIVRKVLEQQSLDQAEHLLQSVKHASGQNYILSSDNAMRCFECSGSSVVRYIPVNHPERVFHSNHPLVNQDETDLLPIEKRRSPNTLARLASISQRLGDNKQPVTLAAIKAALAAHDDAENPVSRVLGQCTQGNAIGYTAGASIYEFSAPPRLHLAAGPPCETGFDVFEFNPNP